jgi:ectoine hydroxylase-related dioxygenase (phytanoyl-CoA dioxygenase family)
MTGGQVKTVHEFPCREGDVILFPSFVVHRAPSNPSPETKTIISFNFDCNIARRF